MIALLPLLALAATTSFAVPLSGRQAEVEITQVDNATDINESVQGCFRKYRGNRNGTHHGRPRPSASGSETSAIVVPSDIATPSASDIELIPSSAPEVLPTSVAEIITSVEESAPASSAISVIGENNAARPTSMSAAAPAVTSAAASGSSGSTGSAELDEVLAIHNSFRASYGAGPLSWNTTLAEHAKGVSSTCKFAHSGTKGMGENLAAGVGGGWTGASGVNGWNNEASQYDYNNPVFGSGTGHFTQVVWKSTTQVGCAVVDCPNGSIFDSKYNAANKFLTCNYYTPGNYAGQFTDNVGKKIA